MSETQQYILTSSFKLLWVGVLDKITMQIEVEAGFLSRVFAVFVKVILYSVDWRQVIGKSRETTPITRL